MKSRILVIILNLLIGVEKKTELAIKLIDKTIERKYQPGIVLIDAGYGNNTSLLLELERRQLK